MMYPLRFEPIFRRYLWGGRRLGEVLNKPIGEHSDYAESWEIVDHGADQSVVSHGPLSGKTLGELVQSEGAALLGRHHPQPRFPLLVKLLDAHAQLSVQVHPNDHQAAQLTPPDYGKTEAWYILAAEPGSYIYAGLKHDCDREALATKIAEGTCEECLHRLEPKAGEVIYLPAGTVHALGPGLIVVEVQQSSDTTFRMYDWNRLGPDGKTRALHIDQALDVTDFNKGPVTPQQPQATSASHRDRLVESDKFVWDRCTLSEAISIGGDDRFHVLSVIEGSIEVEGDPSQKPLVRGEAILLPAALPSRRIVPAKEAILMDVYLP